MKPWRLPVLACGLLWVACTAVAAPGVYSPSTILVADNSDNIGQAIGQIFLGTLQRALQQRDPRQGANPIPPSTSQDMNLVTVARMGISGRNISNTGGDIGCQVRRFYPDSPLPATGVELNDVIFALDGAQIRGCADLARRTAAASPGQVVQFDVSDIVKGVNVRMRAQLVTPSPSGIGQQPGDEQAQRRAAKEQQQQAERERQREAKNAERRQKELVLAQQRAAEREHAREQERLALQQQQQEQQRQQAELARQNEAQQREQQRLAEQRQMEIQQQRATEERQRLWYLTAILAAPLIIGLAIFLGRIKVAVSLIDRLNTWLSTRRELMRANRGAYGMPSRFLVGTLCVFKSWTGDVKNPYLAAGTQIAIYTYFIGAIAYAAVVMTIFLIIAALGILLAIWFWGYFMPSLMGLPTAGNLKARRSSSKTVANSSNDEPQNAGSRLFGQRGTTLHQGANWFTEQKVGRTDENGNIHEGSNWFTEKKVGRVDEDGNIHEGSNWFTEKKVGRTDEDGNIYEGSNWFTEKKVGRIDEDGNVYEGSNWFTEKKVGRAEKND